MEFEAVLLADHVRLLDEACASMSKRELRKLVQEIAEEVQSFYRARATLKGHEHAFDLRQFVARSLAHAKRRN